MSFSELELKNLLINSSLSESVNNLNSKNQLKNLTQVRNAFDLNNYLIDDLLVRWIELQCLLLEARVPLLDHNLQSFA